jgi:hypothetical protein
MDDLSCWVRLLPWLAGLARILFPGSRPRTEETRLRVRSGDFELDFHTRKTRD